MFRYFFYSIVCMLVYSIVYFIKYNFIILDYGFYYNLIGYFIFGILLAFLLNFRQSICKNTNLKGVSNIIDILKEKLKR